MEFLLRIKFDPAKADEHNKSLYSGPEYDDPVIGDGRSLIRDVIVECGVDELAGQTTGLSDAIVSVEATVDGEPIDYPRGSRWAT